jgi:hypothetical protein
LLTNFQISNKTKRPACCDFDCCGNHFGRIERRSRQSRIHSKVNRIKLTRRYAKHVENQLVRKEILLEMGE